MPIGLNEARKKGAKVPRTRTSTVTSFIGSRSRSSMWSAITRDSLPGRHPGERMIRL